MKTPNGTEQQWQSCVLWPEEIPLGCIPNVSKDRNGSRQHAMAVCRRIESEGYGGDGQIFPLATWVEPILDHFVFTDSKDDMQEAADLTFQGKCPTCTEAFSKCLCDADLQLGFILPQIFEILDDQVGDTDPYIPEHYSDEDIRENEPLFWCVNKLSRFVGHSVERSDTDQISELVQQMGDGPSLGDDAIIYHGSATWDQWQCHVPIGIVELWPRLSQRERNIIFLCCVQMVFYKAPK